ncbi:MAG: hypothetical protein CW346_19015, partial [Bacillaceae bacterium]|nr:hypothetical protein [Bacillaceae bacterium]
MSTDSTFFASKRRWSEIKDRILRGYLKPYLNKVDSLGKRFVLVDGFAGPGTFGEGEHLKEGSPLIITRLAEEIVPGRYTAYFSNKNRKHHQALGRALRPWLEAGCDLRLVNDTASRLLEQVNESLTDQSLFIFLDPFGLKGCSFDMILPFLRRPKKYSTELLINISTRTLHRLAAAKSNAGGRGYQLKESWHRILTEVLGG